MQRRCGAVWSAQLIVQPGGNVGKHFLPVGLHQQFVPGAGVQLAADVLHACGLQALDGAQHALAPVAHRVGGAGQEQQGQVLGHPGQKSRVVQRRMPLNML